MARQAYQIIFNCRINCYNRFTFASSICLSLKSTNDKNSVKIEGIPTIFIISLSQCWDSRTVYEVFTVLHICTAFVGGSYRLSGKTSFSVSRRPRSLHGLLGPSKWDRYTVRNEVNKLPTTAAQISELKTSSARQRRLKSRRTYGLIIQTSCIWLTIYVAKCFEGSKGF